MCLSSVFGWFEGSSLKLLFDFQLVPRYDKNPSGSYIKSAQEMTAW